MSEEYKLEIINPEQSFLVKEDVVEVVAPAFEGEMGILKDHIPIISFLKPGILKVISKSSEEKYYLEDGIVEFKDNNLSILTSFIVKTTEFEKDKLNDFIQEAEKEIENPNLNDQKKYLIDQKIEALKLLSIN
tara:strand:+ start:242 stop:640 length:399 start_codon:yes stop_codon:yes gene_type:complete